jgi:hypothetical protein
MPGLRSYDRPPDPEEFDAVVDQQADQIDQAAAQAGPSGEYSGSRLKAFSTALDAALANFGGDMPPMEGGQGDIAGPLPAELVKRYTVLTQAEADFAASTGEQPTLPSIDSLVSSESLVIATTAIKKLAKDRDFKRFLAEPAPEEAPAPVVEEEMMVEEEEPVNPEVALL